MPLPAAVEEKSRIKPALPPKTICYCLNLKRNVIVRAIQQGKVTSVEQIRARFLAGSRCGGCVSALQALLAENIGDIEV